MTLEDHVGDVLSKARNSAGISVEAAAAAAGLASRDYADWEASGQTSGRPNYSSLAPLLELSADKLQRIAEGWQPAAADVSRWHHLRQITTRGASFTVNCYLIWDDATHEAGLFDTGFQADPILELIQQNRLQLRHVFITHSHSDHVAALQDIRTRFSEARVHSSSNHAPASQRNRPGETVRLGGLAVSHRGTPGHAEDGVTYVVSNFPGAAPDVAVVGDAIFAGSMGGARQLAALAKQKIRDEILSLPGNTLICPGHGPLTTVAEEQSHNPFF